MLGRVSVNGYMSASDAARELGLSVSAVTRRLQLGHVPGQKIGGVWWIAAKDLPVLAGVIHPRPRKSQGTRKD